MYVIIFNINFTAVNFQLEDLIALYTKSCEKHGTDPLENVIEQLRVSNFVIIIFYNKKQKIKS